jgi:hypothetical protein
VIRRLSVPVAAGLLTTAVVLLLAGPGRTCDLTPVCPPGAICPLVKVAGRCPLTTLAVLVAAGLGIVVTLVAALARRRGR